MEPNFEEILKSKGITPKTKYHVYDYLYKSMLEAMKEAYNLAAENLANNTELKMKDILEGLKTKISHTDNLSKEFNLNPNNIDMFIDYDEARKIVSYLDSIIKLKVK